MFTKKNCFFAHFMIIIVLAINVCLFYAMLKPVVDHVETLNPYLNTSALKRLQYLFIL